MAITELRVELESEEVVILDGYCAGTGKKRTEVIRKILREWSDAKVHEATLVLRFAGRHPVESESYRK